MSQERASRCPAHPALRAPRRRTAWVVLLGLLALSSCRFSTQRWPGPMRAEVNPLPPGARFDYAPGPEPVLVYRHADPVSVARAGDVAGFPMSFHRKVERLTAGSWMAVGAGGRAEVLWPRDATSVRIYDRCYAVVGEPSRDEPTLVFQEVTRARLHLTPEDRIELLGGAILRGDASEESGPFFLERIGEELLRVRNQSKKVMFVDYRRRELAVAPGSLVDLPLLPGGVGGTAPEVLPAGVMEFERDGIALSTRGEVDTSSHHDAWVLRAERDAVVEALGLSVTLLAGERVLMGGLEAPAPRLPAGSGGRAGTPNGSGGPLPDTGAEAAMQPGASPADTPAGPEVPSSPEGATAPGPPAGDSPSTP